MNNKKGIREFLFDNLLWGFGMMCIYRKALFRTLPDCNIGQSKAVLWVLLGFFLFSGIALTIRRARNFFSVFSNAVIAYETYTMISYYRTFPVLYRIVLLVALVSTGMVFLRTAFSGTHSPGTRCIPKALVRCKEFLAIIGLAVIVPLVVSALLGNSMVWKTVRANRDQPEDPWARPETVRAVRNLDEEVWLQLSSTEKLDTLQTIANVERQHLGIPRELYVIVSQTNEKILAYFDHRTYTIKVNIEYFDDRTALETLNSLCHECYHGYQCSLCEAYLDVDPKYCDLLAFQNVPQYLEEFTDYNIGINTSEYYEYYDQLCEVTARSYARTRVLDYYHLIYDEQDTLPGRSENAAA